ncbi:MAG: N-acetyltransferase [Candidatus Omnitrophota bacterium]
MIRKANIQDLKKIQELINFYAKQDKMLPRSLNELYENVRDYFVYEEDGEIAGCCALHVAWEDLVEIKSLAVTEARQRQKIGRALVEAALEDAKNLNAKRAFALTYVPEFFEKFGFKRVDHSQLPHKIWSECIKCVKFPDCQETALVKDIA